MNDNQDLQLTYEEPNNSPPAQSSSNGLRKVLAVLIAILLIGAVSFLTIKKPGGSAYIVSTAYGIGDTGPTATPTLGVGDTTPFPTLSIAPTGVGSTVPTSTPTLTLTPTSTPSPTLTPTPTPDTTAPVVQITSPLNGTTVPKNTNVTIAATATDNVGVTRVEFYTGGVLRCTDTVSPYSCMWLVPKKPNVLYQIQAKGYDAAGNNNSHLITVTSR